ncbi:TadE/TadG family type IV pilus assembly protein [Haloechinothrix salitolerans]|uniref:TadE/TadG family type IV pilus assembly protein n=1 Tax=Haloechinothrix salitolerans TaxID=926830 RepID=A0ABW2C6G0_9PSEU
MPHRCDDAGSVTVELAVLAMAFLLVGLLMAAGGRIYSAQEAVDHAAAVAARDASLARTPAAATVAARDAAADVLVQRGLTCRPDVSVHTGGFAARPGEFGVARVSLSCGISLSDLAALPGLPGSVTVSSTFASPIDPFRARTP